MDQKMKTHIYFVQFKIPRRFPENQIFLKFVTIEINDNANESEIMPKFYAEIIFWIQSDHKMKIVVEEIHFDVIALMNSFTNK